MAAFTCLDSALRMTAVGRCLAPNLRRIATPAIPELAVNRHLCYLPRHDLVATATQGEVDGGQ